MITKKQYASIGIIGILLAGAYAAGRFSAPDRVVTVDHSEEVTRLRLEVASLTQRNTALERHTFKRSVTAYGPTGKPVSKTDTVETHVDRKSTLTSGVRVSSDTHSANLTDKKTEVDRMRPNWRVGPQVDLNLRTGAVGYGATVERRLFGPLSLRIGGSSSGTVSAGITLEF